MNRISLLIRKLTIPPVFAAMLLVWVYSSQPSCFGGLQYLFFSIFFLAILPVLAYPLQSFIPMFKDKGREGQRTLAMLFSFVGYLAGTVMAFACSVPAGLKVIFLEYLLCGILMLLFNKVCRMRASGHACGIVGPVLLLCYFRLYLPAMIGALLVIPVFISSLRTKRHTALQLIGGSLIPLAVLGIIMLLMK